jgi:guanylate kinase
MQQQKIVILCGPSGSGKTTITKHLLQMNPVLAFSISATTRNKRSNEKDGKDYHFLRVEDFKNKIKEDAFVEFEEVYKDVFYGTLKSELEQIWKKQKIPVLDIDVIGATNIKKNYAPNALTIFVHPINLENLKHRLHQRATESAESFAKRIHKAEEELSMADTFEKIVYNDTLEKATEQANVFVNQYISQS